MTHPFIMSTQAPWNKILVAVDFSSHSLQAVREARSFQQAAHVEVVLLHVTPPAFDGLRIHTGDFHKETQNSAREQLAALIPVHFPGSTSVSTLVKDGHPVETICDVARMLAADVIFIGTHGISAVEHYMLGSVAEKVVRHAPCRVLVVR
ncbi:MAG TPA: universal stress protein [Prosthecobacter sp.]|nr:universal stress protein [Prosthecobacter sp.]